ncbi:MAG: hypothetical protein ACI8VE_002699, partial [Natrialbaceae archaeon]
RSVEDDPIVDDAFDRRFELAFVGILEEAFFGHVAWGGPEST